jgi:hypothetical protein
MWSSAYGWFLRMRHGKLLEIVLGEQSSRMDREAIADFACYCSFNGFLFYFNDQLLS